LSLQDRKTAEPASSAMPLWLGLAAAVVLVGVGLSGSNLAPGPTAAMMAKETMAKLAAANDAMAKDAAAKEAAAKDAAAKDAMAKDAAAKGAAAKDAAAKDAMAKDAAAKDAAAKDAAAKDAMAKDAAAKTAAAAAVATTAVAAAAGPAPTPDVPLDQLLAPGPLPDNVLGDAKAPVTIVEYASMTCPHCADFHKRVFPDFKAKYIDTGKVKLIFREFPLDNLAAAVSELARCLGPVRYFAFIGTMFDRQAEWHTGDNDLPKLQDISKQAGFTDDSFKKCVTDQKLLDGIKETRKIADEKYHVDSTPTFFVNGVKLKEGHEMADFDKVISAFIK